MTSATVSAPQSALARVSHKSQPLPSEPVEAPGDWYDAVGSIAHGPSRVNVVRESGGFEYRGNDPFWTQILGTWHSRHDTLSPDVAHNWVLLIPCPYLAHYDAQRHSIIYEEKP